MKVCSAINCSEPIQQAHCMCSYHWKMVSLATRNIITQSRPRGGAWPSRTYARAYNQAIEEAAAVEAAQAGVSKTI